MRISTLDNSGWSVVIDLIVTNLAGLEMNPT
ncbi:Imm53 family immunity protein [Paludibaculum fermentans]